MKFYVYYLSSEDKPFYVGKGKANRCKIHLKHSHNADVNSKILECWRLGIPVKIYRKYFLTEKAAFDCEIKTIANFKNAGFKLCNKTEGGEGVSGYKWSKIRKENKERQYLRLHPRTSKYFGVIRCGPIKWMAIYKKKVLGTFNTPELAARAYNLICKPHLRNRIDNIPVKIDRRKK